LSSLLWTIPVHLWRGDKEIAEELIALLIELGRGYSLGPTLAIGLGWQGALAILAGRAGEGIELLQNGLSSLSQANYQMLETAFLGYCAEGLAATGNLNAASASVDTAIERTMRRGEAMYMPELLRIKGEIALLAGDGNTGETLLLQALTEAESQAVPSLALRAAISFARHKKEQNKPDEALKYLAPAFDRFSEGFDTADLNAAAALLRTLGQTAKNQIKSPSVFTATSVCPLGRSTL
jgi:predicted ATPase